MALSADTQNRLNKALTSVAHGQEFAAKIISRSALSAACKAHLKAAVASAPAAEEIAAAVVSGAALSRNAKRRILIAIAKEQPNAGNELINAIQTVPTAPILL